VGTQTDRLDALNTMVLVVVARSAPVTRFAAAKSSACWLRSSLHKGSGHAGIMRASAQIAVHEERRSNSLIESRNSKNE
jgi:hypothetical protein